MPEPLLRRRRAYRSFAGVYLMMALFTLAIWSVAFIARGDVSPTLVALAGLVPPLLAVGYSWLARLATEYRVHQESIEVESGIIARNVANLQLFRVRDLGLSQSVLGRLLGVGDVSVTSTDQSTPNLVLRGIDDPRGVYEMLRDLVTTSQATRRTMILENEGRSSLE